tara:strand:- start:204 stop:644 length:441 start_codon:yes stop_codon:yes gene_type:complete
MLSLLQEELVKAMKAKDRATLIGIRNMIGKLKSLQIDRGKDLTKQESIQILQSSAKQLKDSIRQYKKGGRDDLADIEAFELKLINKYLPKQLSEDEIRSLIQKTIKSCGTTSMQDMGKIMGIVMKELMGTADGKIVQKIVQEELNS